MEIWFSSDHHFSHYNIIDYCNRDRWRQQFYPFAPQVHWMNTELVELWNETVGPDDLVIYLGDFAMGKRQSSVPIARRLHGKKILLPGNHDSPWIGHRHRKYTQSERAEFYRQAGFFDVILVNEMRFGDYKLCHFPYVGDSHDADRYDQWRPVDDGTPLIHGHVHTAYKKRDHMVNVGVDVWDYKPVHFDTLRELLAQ